jgi:thioredoxin 1
MSFETHINGSKPVVVDFFATWCGPCKMMEPILKQLKSKTGEKVTILKLDVDKNPHHANRYGIQAVPTVMIFKEGKILWRKSGVANVNELMQQLEPEMA